MTKFLSFCLCVVQVIQLFQQKKTFSLLISNYILGEQKFYCFFLVLCITLPPKFRPGKLVQNFSCYTRDFTVHTIALHKPHDRTDRTHTGTSTRLVLTLQTLLSFPTPLSDLVGRSLALTTTQFLTLRLQAGCRTPVRPSSVCIPQPPSLTTALLTLQAGCRTPVRPSSVCIRTDSGCSRTWSSSCRRSRTPRCRLRVPTASSVCKYTSST